MLKFISNITPFANNDQLKWRAFLDDETCEIIIWDDSINAEICRIGESSSIHFVTYVQLTTLISTNNLITGNFYVITDFRTREHIPNTPDIPANYVLGDLEPLIVQAVANNKISSQAKSTIFQKDEVLYNPENDLPNGTRLDDLGEHKLKDLRYPVHIVQYD